MPWGILIKVDAANFHSLQDQDHYIVEGFSFFEDVEFALEHLVNAGSSDVDVILTTPDGGHIASGRTSVKKSGLNPGPFRIEVKSRYPGLFAAYDLNIRVKPLKIPDDLTHLGQLKAFVESMALIWTREGKKIPDDIDCLNCNLLGSRGKITYDRRGGDVTKPVEITRFISLESRSELVLSGVARDATIKVVGKDFRPIVGNPRRGGLVFDLQPGPYSVTWKPGKRDRDLDYSLLPSRAGSGVRRPAPVKRIPAEITGPREPSVRPLR